MIEPSPFATLRQISSGYGLSSSLHAVAKLGVADKLDETPRSGAELAAAVGADEEALSRVMRLLASHSVFEVHNGKFAHSPASRMLRTDHPQSMRDHAQMFGLPPFWAAFGELEHSVRTGQQVGEKVTPGGLWAYFAQHPEANAIFNSNMAAKAQANIAGIMKSYDFTEFKLIGDIGGGRGHLLRAVLDAAPDAKGVLFDQPHVINDAAAVASPNLSLQAGDFFKDKLPSCDAYMLMEVIHDWSDAESIAILKAIRRAAPPQAKLLLIEEMLSADPGPDWAKMLDIFMLVLIGGKQRTREEYAALFEQGGFSFKREIDTGTGMSILEAVAI